MTRVSALTYPLTITNQQKMEFSGDDDANRNIASGGTGHRSQLHTRYKSQFRVLKLLRFPPNKNLLPNCEPATLKLMRPVTADRFSPPGHPSSQT
jgi:hypothetical protein